MNTLIEKILKFKNITSKQYQQLFSDAKLSDFKDAHGMDVVIKRILQAKNNNEKIFVGGDYDADGICATAILIDTLRKLEIKCGYYIPNRIKEGYGLQPKTVERVVEKGYDLIITVDNGVKAQEALKRCDELGIDIIVTDHHTYDEELSCPMLHSFTMGEQYKYLSGAGIALGIARALDIKDPKHVVLAGVAILADMMELWNENRIIVKETIKYLNQGKVAAIQRFGTKSTIWNETELSFNVIPKLNAAGRLSELMDVNKIVEFLLSENKEFIDLYYERLEQVNLIRKKRSQAMHEEALQQMQEYEFPILHSEKFHEGIVGLVAGRIVNEHQKPVIVFTEKDNILKGSARAIPNMNLIHFFEDFKHNFLQFGGHQAAAGISMEKTKLALLYEYVNTKEIPPCIKQETLEITLDDLSVENVESLNILRPFGKGFSMPLFELKNVPIQKQIRLGKGNHYRLEINDFIEVLYFNRPNFSRLKERTILFNQITIKNTRQKPKITIVAV